MEIDGCSLSDTAIMGSGDTCALEEKMTHGGCQLLLCCADSLVTVTKVSGTARGASGGNSCTYYDSL